MEVATQVYGGMWIRLSPPVKNKIAELFNIPKNGASHVNDNIVIADGYLDRDLAILNVESLQKYLESNDTDIFRLWNMLVAQVETSLLPPPPAPELEKKTEINITIENGQPIIKTTEVKFTPEFKPEYQPPIIKAKKAKK